MAVTEIIGSALAAIVVLTAFVFKVTGLKEVEGNVRDNKKNIQCNREGIIEMRGDMKVIRKDIQTIDKEIRRIGETTDDISKEIKDFRIFCSKMEQNKEVLKNG